ncbi:hypothetical protein GH5_00694 [Leishmania sp. Ghana 2012 LV757]|uniref:Uncharacterized protein n=1 Tax=Leishmania orientalis TaxID=2249476 RepID=A0A836KGZ7_9TRYP|nr:hypothetical protein LSCM4_00687 [Leishmania orientalis]KAG5489811.1 hypothetical protein GH5_00694 [Leishmania sp. Ghana 2012 LV757]
MLEFLLRGYLWYLSFVQPVIYGAQLCHSPHPDALQVTNVTLTLIFAWLLEVADVLLLSSFISIRWPYLCARILLALCFAHHRFLGAVKVYQKLFATLVDAYSPVIDCVVGRHMQTIGDSGLIQYGTQVCTGLLRGIATVAGIAETLMEACTTTRVPAAPLPRQMLQERDGGEEEGVRVSPSLRPTSLICSVRRPPPSLFGDDSDERRWPAQRIVDYTLETESLTKGDAWCDMEYKKSNAAPLYAALEPRQPATVVNRAHRHLDPSNPLGT